MAGRRIELASIVGIAAGVAMLVPLCAPAAERWNGSIAAATDYIYRGISLSDHGPAVQGGLQWQIADGWSAGAWASTVDFPGRGGASYEIDLHLSRSWALNPDWSAQLGVAHYEYPDDTWLSYDYDELTASLSFQQRITGSVAYSPNATRYGDDTPVRNKSAISYELTVQEPVSPYWAICAGVGYYDLDDLFDTGYVFWNAGVTFSWNALQIDVLHIDTDAEAERLFGYRASRHRWTAALSWRF
jgi:uncharacterized protein (TIGR02001 family)